MSNFRMNDADRMATLLKALASPQRLRIFMRLTQCCGQEGCGELTAEGIRRCVGDLAKDMDLAPSTVSHHLRELRLAGVMNMQRCGQRIECWIREDALRLLADFFVEARAAACRREGQHTCPQEGGCDGTREP